MEGWTKFSRIKVVYLIITYHIWYHTTPIIMHIFFGPHTIFTALTNRQTGSVWINLKVNYGLGLRPKLHFIQILHYHATMKTKISKSIILKLYKCYDFMNISFFSESPPFRRQWPVNVPTRERICNIPIHNYDHKPLHTHRI